MKSHRSDRLRPLLAIAVPVLALTLTIPVRADDVPAESADVTLAREEFIQGTALVKKAQWAEALAKFEHSAKLRPHAATTYNIGACQRAMGSYTLARKTLVRALAQNEAGGGTQLSESIVTDTKGFIAEIDKLVATAEVTLEPANAAIAVDGRPLETQAQPASNKSGPLLLAGVLPPGPGEAPPAKTFRLELNPGAHVFTMSRKGFADAVVNKTMLPGSSTKLALQLDLLPATLHIASTPSGAIVTVAGADVGPTPVDVARPPGSYHVVAKKSGYVAYEAQVVLRAGEEINLRMPMAEEKIALTQRWWFWTGASVLLVGAAAGTYFLTRPAPTAERPPVDGGTLQWPVSMK